MPTALVIFLFALLFVGLFVLGMSLTLIIKGHDIDSDIATNRHMRERGIRCAVEEARSEMAGGDCTAAGCPANCAACDIEQSIRTAEREKVEA